MTSHREKKFLFADSEQKESLTEAVDEQALLRALERLGPSKEGGSNNNSHSHSGFQNRENNNNQRRRRFVQDGDVLVERQALSRSSRVMRDNGEGEESNKSRRLSNVNNSSNDEVDNKIESILQNLQQLHASFRVLNENLGTVRKRLDHAEETIAFLLKGRDVVQKEKISNYIKPEKKQERVEEDLFIPDENGQQPVKWWVK